MLPIVPKIVQPTQETRSQSFQRTPIKETQSTNKAEKTNKLQIVIPKLLVFLGFILVLTQAIPLGISFVSGYYLSENSSAYLPVSDSFMKTLFSITYVDPGSAYFEAVVAKSKASKIDIEYKKNMKLTIANADINRVNLQPNIPGNDATIYDDALKHGVAHLKGTSLPGDPGVSVIYGHSGVAGFLVGKSSPEIVFSRLDTVSIGDTMSIERDGKELRYVVSGKKIIEPQDLAFMSESGDKERAILLTCWPLGIGTKRLIIIADRI